MNLFACQDKECSLLPAGTHDRRITGVSCDSRQVSAGNIFVVIRGEHFDGRDYIISAVARGAAVLLGDPSIARFASDDVPVLISDDPRRSYARLAAQFFPEQPARTFAVTGTNGKTSVAWFAMQLCQQMGYKAASLGTLGLLGDVDQIEGHLTTPDALQLHHHLQQCHREGVSHICIEASSHGLDQRRLDGVTFSAAAFTNLSRDHFDYHGNLETYYHAKKRLFSLLPDGAPAIINTDDPYGQRIIEAYPERQFTTYGYGDDGDGPQPDLKIDAISESADGLALDLTLWSEAYQCTLPVVGYFQAMNSLAALGLVVSTGAEPARAIAALSALTAPPGRMQRIGKGPRGGTAFVDYAHTPDALKTALEATRRLDTGKLTVVFGCGGDRDRGKRKQMGAIASELADEVIVTDDNPRSEDPVLIRAEIMAACPDAIEIGDRAEAIGHAIALMRETDCVLIAGKGHESGQIVGGETLPFDDAEVVRNGLHAAGMPV